jgi:hypothetical protein
LGSGEAIAAGHPLAGHLFAKNDPIKVIAPLDRQRVYPTLGPGLQVWVGVGGSPESVVRVVRQDLQLMLATGWQPHSVRGAISGLLRKRLGWDLAKRG